MQAYAEEYFKSQHYSEKEVAVKELYLRFLKWAHVDQGEGKSALDVGAGFGYVVRLLEELGYRSVGLEISQYACEHSGLGSRMIHGDAESFVSEPCSFDLVTAFEVIEHVSNPKKVLDAIYQALKPRGTFLMTTPTHFGNVLLCIFDLVHGRFGNANRISKHKSVLDKNSWIKELVCTRFTAPLTLSYLLLPFDEGYTVLGNSVISSNIALTAVKG